MRLVYVLPTVFGLAAAGLGGQLLWKASRLTGDDPDQLTMLLKGGTLAFVGLLMLGLLIWKAGLRRR